MAFTIRLCPFCGGAINSEEAGFFVCEECDKRSYRSRTYSRVYLQNKPYEADYGAILDVVDISPEKALEQINAVMDSVEEPDTDMYFTRGLVYTAMGEEGKAHIDWKKGLEVMTDLRNIDAYIMPVCRGIMDTIIIKEREFLDFSPLEYIDTIATEFSLKAGVPCRGLFYLSLYRDFRTAYQSGKLDDDDEIYQNIVVKILPKILAYGRDYRMVVDAIDEMLEDFHYNPDTYIEDDNMMMHICDMLKSEYQKLAENFSDAHIERIYRHWNDENMFELEYWVDELMKSIKDDSILQKVRWLRTKENFNLEDAVEGYARKFLLLSEDGEDLSKEA